MPDGIAGPATLTAFRTRTGVPLPLTPKRKAIRRVVVPAENPATVRATLDHWAGHYGLDPSLARALAWMESGYNPNVTSSVGAWGVMQILPTTWTYVETSLIGRPVPRTAEGNVHVGTALLHHLLKVFDGNETLALGAWYQGERAVRSERPLPRDPELRRERARAEEPPALGLRHHADRLARGRPPVGAALDQDALEPHAALGRVEAHRHPGPHPLDRELGAHPDHRVVRARSSPRR